MSRLVFIINYAILAFASARPRMTRGSLHGDLFSNPPPSERPLFRYWLPDASIDGNNLAKDIASAQSVGAGGIELVPFYNYGSYGGNYPPGADWETYNFGTSAFNELFITALEKHQELGTKMDFAIGPNQGQGVPCQIDDEGLQWDLIPVVANSSTINFWNNTIPGWGSGKLVAFIAGQVLSQSTEKIDTDTFLPSGGPTYTRLVLSHTGLIDLTDQISTTGRFATATNDSETLTPSTCYFAFYERKSLVQNVRFPTNVTDSIFANGSYTVDHFSARGAKTTIEFWERFILNTKVKTLLRQAGGLAWEDSAEIVSKISWTSGLLDVFERLNGYQLRRYLPLVMFGNNNHAVQSSNPGAFAAVLDTADQGASYVNDYRKTLQNGYREYLQTLQNWAHGLGIGFSTQVSYNLPMDASVNLDVVDVPECESLGFVDSIDAYRAYTGPAQLAGKHIISNEMGAEQLKAYSYTIPRLLYSVNRAYAGGVNRIVLHGQSYTGKYFGTSWPGFTAFQYVFSELWSEKQPVWSNGLQQTMNYLSRAQHVLQTGVEQLDLAIYNKASLTQTTEALYESSDLVAAGYTYAYLNDENLSWRAANVAGKNLAPSFASFQALILNSGSMVTKKSWARIVEFAMEGLPVIIAGADPVPYPESDAIDVEALASSVSTLVANGNMRRSALGAVGKQLVGLGVSPRASGQVSNGTWRCVWRSEGRDDVDIVFVLGDTKATTGNLRIQSNADPYWLNLWTGSMEPVLAYQRSDATAELVIPLSLEGNQTAVIGLFRQTTVRGSRLHATYLPSMVRDIIISPGGDLIARVIASTTTQASNAQIELSDGKKFDVSQESRSTAPGFVLNDWTLIAEHWQAPNDLTDASVIATKINTTHRLQAPLPSWDTLPALQNVSGVGYYFASFDWPENFANGSIGAYIKLPPLLHAATLRINNQSLPPLDINAPTADIGQYLCTGQNTATIIVPTTMWNYLKSISRRLSSSGGPPLQVTSLGINFPTPPRTDNGLVGNVIIQPYSELKLNI